VGLLLNKPARRGFSIAVLTALVAMVAFASQASAKPDPFYGVVSQTSLRSGDFAKMEKGGIGTLRSIMQWSSIDPTAAADDYSWSGFDAVVADAARHDLRVLPFLYGTPNWVAHSLDHRQCGVCDTFAPHRKAALGAWRDFVVAAVARYGTAGDFWSEHPELPIRPIRAWQIWNEQNSKTFYAPHPSVKGYAKLLGVASGAIHAADRHADVILGGMAELAGSRKAIAGPKYLRSLYRRHGVEHDFDGVGVHPYGAKATTVEQQVGRFRVEIQRAHDSRTGLWITETGWGSSNGSNPLEVGKSGQADRLGDALGYFHQNRGRLRIKAVVWFSWRDSAQSICAWCASSGLLTKSGRPKPAFRTLKRLAR
jgi:hypothetical protein